MKYTLRLAVLTWLGVSVATLAGAHINPKLHNSAERSSNKVEYREGCDSAIEQRDMAINNVRARLLTGGDLWWDGNSNGRYIVPKVAAGQPEVSAIFAGAVWLGGVDPAGNLKVAAQTYGRSGGNFDFWTGPIDEETGMTDQETCAKWDRFFDVRGSEIDEHLRLYEESRAGGKTYSEADVPQSVKGWPGTGNPFFFDVHLFELPNTIQGLAPFWDEDADGIYDPTQGDYPIIEVRGCEEPQYPDEMFFWIYNDAGNIHAESNGDPIQMEIQAQAFAYATNDELNDMSFLRYKLINRALESIDSMFFAMWVDPDLGCHTDDFVGCDTTRSLAYVYNSDAIDGTAEGSTACDGGVSTYQDRVPILGVDYFRGPLDENFQELGMSSFTYYNNGGQGNPPNGTTDPQNAQQFYNYLSGSWLDGSPFTFGGNAYQSGGEQVNYAFSGNPNSDDWSMCTAGVSRVFDRRTIQATGPFRLDPGAVNELIIGVVWVADQLYPCPDIRQLQTADDIAQALFDNCFDITDGPDAPDVDFLQLDQEIIAVFTNDEVSSNNSFEGYQERGLKIPDRVADSLYQFEGYKLYQLANPSVTLSDLDDPSKALLVTQVDLKNGVDDVFNWEEVDSPTTLASGRPFRAPVMQVEGKNEGIRHTFRITEDLFGSGDRSLTNHKKYYFLALAYAYNNYEAYDVSVGTGQEQPYLEGRRNIGDGVNPYYTVIPRPITYNKLNASYGDGAVVTRIDGVGVGGNSLDISDGTTAAILDGTFNGEITYKQGAGPIDVQIYNPLDVRNGDFVLTFEDSDLSDDELEPTGRWRLIDQGSGKEIVSETTLDNLNEQVVGDYGFSIEVGQTADAGDNADETNGFISADAVYADSEVAPWFGGLPEGTTVSPDPAVSGVFDFIVTGGGQEDAALDQNQAFTQFSNGWYPYFLCDWRTKVNDVAGIGYISPAWTQVVGGSGGSLVRNQMTSATPSGLRRLNNVDIVFTSDKSKWSRCVVIETASPFYQAQGFESEGGSRYFDLRSAASVSKDDNDGDGLPDPDGDGTGMGWFPGYAIDIETGERLNIFFGENSVYNGTNFPEAFPEGLPPTGGDMMWNPTSNPAIPGNQGLFNFVAGSQHFIYVTRQAYDGCMDIRQRFSESSVFRKVSPLLDVTWTTIPLARGLLSYQDGLVPNDLTVKLRVDNPYTVEVGTGEFNGYPTYKFSIEGSEKEVLTSEGVENALDTINVVPNPYYGFSAYETSQFSNIVKITNLPAACVVTIYSLDGKFIRQYNRNEIGAPIGGNNRALDRRQINPDIEWDLKNTQGIPIASGVYLIHVDAPGLGERVIKWMGVARQFDPSGL